MIPNTIQSVSIAIWYVKDKRNNTVCIKIFGITRILAHARREVPQFKCGGGGSGEYHEGR